MYQPRTYRHWVKDRSLIAFTVTVKETDLYIRARRHLEAEALASVLRHRTPLEEYISRHPDFLHTLKPIAVDEAAPSIVKEMALAAEKVGVGPMAAVAGAIAEAVGRDLLAFTSEVIVENGGDIHLRSGRERRVGVFAGDSPWSGRLAIKVKPTPPEGVGVCTSSATVGPSYSAGVADCALVIAESAALADASASTLGNRAKGPERIEEALEAVAGIKGVVACLLIIGERLGARGDLELEGL